MPYLKYYKIENQRYGEMGAITPEEAKRALELAFVKFNLPRVQILTGRKNKRVSHYHTGVYMVGPNLRLAKPLAVPKIVIAPAMWTWLTVIHELAHHMHYVRFDQRVRAKAIEAGVNVEATDAVSRSRYIEWVRNKSGFKKEHCHGHAHREFVQKLVDYFYTELKLIKVQPEYMKKLVVASSYSNSLDVSYEKVAV